MKRQIAVLALVLVPALVSLPALPAFAQTGKPTPLLSDDIQTNKRTKIDAPADDLGLDSLTGEGDTSGFSTKVLEQIEDKLRADLARERPRAPPRLVVFLYPGRVSTERLRSMSEVYVDVELVIDPCDRSVCRDAVGRHIELVGRAVGNAERAGRGFKLIFKNLTLTTRTQSHDVEVGSYRVPIAECIAAGAHPGGGLAWLDARQKAEEDFEPIAARSVAHQLSLRRVQTAVAPSVARQGREVTVALRIKGDRNRVQQQVMDALVAAESGLRENPATPPTVHLEVEAEVALRKVETRKFRSLGQPVGLMIDGKLDGDTLWSNYVEEVKQGEGATNLSFVDADPSGHASSAGSGGTTWPGGGPGGEPDDAQAIAVLAQNFSSLGDCARTEAARNPHFGGITIVFDWTPSGRAEHVLPKEDALKAGPLARCLGLAMSKIALPRFSGGPREIEYPIRVR